MPGRGLLDGHHVECGQLVQRPDPARPGHARVPLFAVREQDRRRIKAVLAFSMSSISGGLGLSFVSPGTWPMKKDTSATYVDVKVFSGNEVLFHWVLKACRSDSDLSVQRQF